MNIIILKSIIKLFIFLIILYNFNIFYLFIFIILPAYLYAWIDREQ